MYDRKASFFQVHQWKINSAKPEIPVRGLKERSDGEV
jgi:hypothetical protein